MIDGCPLALWIGLALWIAPTSVLSHSDPDGDIHPVVTTEGENFVVQARNTLRSTDSENEILRLILDKTGRLLETRRDFAPVSPVKPYQHYSFIDRLPEEQNGLELPWGGNTLIIPESSRKHGGAPFLITSRNSHFHYDPLGWKTPDVEAVEDALIVGESLFLLVTRPDGSDAFRLYLHRFSLRTMTEEASVELPQPALIWSFPVCSKLLEHNGSLFVGIVVPRLFGWRLILATWDGVAPEVRQKTLTSQIDWNTSLSLAKIGDQGLIAYHHPGAYPHPLFRPFPPPASIKTIAFPLK